MSEEHTQPPLPDRLLAFRDAAESTNDDEGNDGRATYVPVSLQTFRQTMDEAAAALSGREAVAFAVYAHSDETGGAVMIDDYIGTMRVVRDRVMEKARREGFNGDFVQRMAELGWWLQPLYTTPQPGDGVVVPREDVSLAAQMLTWGMEEGLTVKQEEDVRQQAEKLFAYAAAPSASPSSTHRYEGNEHGWCKQCGYAEHVELQHGAAAPSAKGVANG